MIGGSAVIKRIKTSLVTGVALMGMSLALNTQTAHALHIAGDYVVSGGLTGTFTSDGNSLTAWEITLPSIPFTWTMGQGVVGANIHDAFQQSIGDHLSFTDWACNCFHYTDEGENTQAKYSVTLTRVPSSVPEPSSASLAGLGLLLLLGYGWRQRRLTGLQVG